MIKPLPLAAMMLAIVAAPSIAQTCPDVRTARDRHAAALSLAGCLGNPNPKVRDALAFEGLSAVMRSGLLERRTITALKGRLLAQLTQADAPALLTSFSALTLAEVARTDRLKPWMSGAERQEMVDAAARFLAGVKDYQAFSDEGGYLHAVAHGADFALQLALNPEVTKPQLDQLLASLATQVSPRDAGVAYWAGEPDRLARAVLFIAQRKQYTDADWKTWFEGVISPAPLASWDVAFNSEIGLRKRHNVRAFLLSVFASASTSDDSGLKLLVAPVRNALRLVP